MSVSSAATQVAYISDGSTPAYQVPLYFFAFTDLIVQLVDNAGNVTTSPMNTDWVGSGTPDAYGAYSSGGTITFQPGRVPAATTLIQIIRSTAVHQLNSFVDNAPFSATVIEHSLDRLTLIATERILASGMIGLLAGPPTSGNYTKGQWFIVTPPVPGGPFGYICTTAGNPGTWKPFASISL